MDQIAKIPERRPRRLDPVEAVPREEEKNKL
jgi:hypothetical protein